MRCLAIDWGEKWIGLAYSPEGDVALPIEPIPSVPRSEALKLIVELIRQKGIERVIIGEPRTLKGYRGYNLALVEDFVRALRRELDLRGINVDVLLFDERYTSKAADNLRRLKYRQRRLRNSLSAYVLLQDYLYYLKRIDSLKKK